MFNIVHGPLKVKKLYKNKRGRFKSRASDILPWVKCQKHWIPTDLFIQQFSKQKLESASQWLHFL